MIGARVCSRLAFDRHFPSMLLRKYILTKTPSLILLLGFKGKGEIIMLNDYPFIIIIITKHLILMQSI